MPTRVPVLIAVLVCQLCAVVANAATLPQPKVYKASIDPHWSSNHLAFWYRNRLPNDAHEFVLVDMKTGERRPAFDHERLAKSLSSILGREIKSTHLPVELLSLSDDLSSITISGSEGSWRLTALTQELSPVPPTNAAPLELEQELKASRSAGPETTLTLENRTGAELQLFWIDADGARQSYGILRPGESRRQHTFAGHVWAAFDELTLVGVVEAPVRPGTAVFETRRTNPRRNRQRSPQADSNAPQEVRSPDGTRVAFVRDHNLWVRDSQTHRETALSFDGNPGRSFRKDAQRARLVGMDYDHPDFPASLPDVIWAPDSRRLIAIQTTTIPERRVHLIESSPRDQLQPRLASYPYLKPGDELPIQAPRLFNAFTEQEIPIRKDLFPNPWEMNRFRWAPDSSRLTFLYNERGHQTLKVLSIDAVFGNVRPLIVENADTFVDYSNKTYLEFIDSSGDVLWMSERSGWNHVYRFDASTGALKNPVTRGDWVVRSVERLDTELRRVWIRISGFHSSQDPYHVHLAAVNLDGSDFRVLTEGDGTHTIQWSPDRKYFVDTWSRVDQPPVIELRNASSGMLVCPLENADASEVVTARGRLPERFTAPGRDGRTPIWGIIHRPRDFKPKGRYPIVENIYAGPHDHHVPKGFRASYRHQEEIADAGFVVVQIDGMGTNWRNRGFHDVAWRNLGDAGFPDRIAWLKLAASRFPEMDLSRIGIYGGSAGGQNAMRALLAHGDFYRAAAADCGCHDNRMDKIWWNEAWMGWPVGPHYAEQSNVVQASRLSGNLLLTVGELDRNVDPASTYQVVKALIQAGKRFEFLPFPGAGHGAAESDYGRQRRIEFFERHLASTPTLFPSASTR